MSKKNLSLKEIVDITGVFFIAEVGVNHEGSIQEALRYIDESSRVGAKAVKFQSFTKDTLFAEEEYCKTLSLKKDSLSQIDGITFKKNWYKLLSSRAIEHKVIFMSTPFSVESIDEMEISNVALYKVASSDINNIPLLKRLAKTKKPVILSTGLAKNSEIKEAIKILKNNEVALLHCIVEYPADIKNLRLNRITALQKAFPKCIIGFSDHSLGIQGSLLAIAKGARIIEKHFTITPERNTVDHPISLSITDFKKLTEEGMKAYASLGDKEDEKPEKVFSEKEEKEFVYAKRGIYLTRDMKKGEIIREEDIIPLRPATGISVSEWNTVISSKLKADKKAASSLTKADIYLKK